MKSDVYGEFLLSLHILITSEFFVPKRLKDFVEKDRYEKMPDWAKRAMVAAADIAGVTYNEIGILKAKAIFVKSLH